jgi:hypothetical protein
MKYYYLYKIFILFLIFYNCNGNNSNINNSILNKSICKQSNKNEYNSLNKNIKYYISKNIVKKKQMNPYVTLSKDILRKYVFIINVVLIYILLNSV